MLYFLMSINFVHYCSLSVNVAFLNVDFYMFSNSECFIFHVHLRMFGSSECHIFYVHHLRMFNPSECYMFFS